MSFFTWAELLSASNPQFVQGITGQNLTDTITVTLPSAPTAGNTLLAAVSFQETVAGGATANLPTGFVQVGSTLNFDGSVSYNYLAVFTFTVPTSPSSSYTFSYTAGSGATIGGIDVQLSEWSGVYASSPIDVYGTSTGSSTTPAVPSVTTTRKNDTLIAVSAFDGRLASTPITYTPPSGYVGFLGDSASTTAPIAAGNADIAFDTPGTTTATNATLSATAPWGTLVLALASVSGAAIFYFNDTMTVTDTAQVQAPADLSSTDNSSLTDSFGITASAQFQLTDSPSVSDSVQVVSVAILSPTADSLSVTDSMQIVGTARFLLTDAMSVSDQYSMICQAVLSISDDLSVDDSFSLYSFVIIREIYASIPVGSSIDQSIRVRDSIGAALTIPNPEINETIGVAESVDASLRVRSVITGTLEL